MLITEEKGILLVSARDAIYSIFSESPPPIIEYEFYPALAQKNKGAFVTITIKNQLRGCIGYIVSEMTLFETVCDAAKQAAMNDPRFPPLSMEEMPYVNIEVSVLSEMRPVNNYEEILIGEHGLLLDEQTHRAVLLPQVAIEHNYSIEDFLTSLCEKAGLYRETWRERKLKLKNFNAEVFSEMEFRKKTYEQL